MKSIRYLIAALFVVAACAAGSYINNWDAVKSFQVSPIAAYALKVAIVTPLMVATGAALGGDFVLKTKHKNVVAIVFALVWLMHLGVALPVSLGEAYYNAVASSTLLLYLVAFYTGLCFGAKK